MLLLRLSRLHRKIRNKKNYILIRYIFILLCIKLEIQELGSRDTYLRIGKSILPSLFTL